MYPAQEAMKQKMEHEEAQKIGVIPSVIQSMAVDVEFTGLAQYMTDQWAKKLECMLCRLDSVLRKSEGYGLG